MPDTQFETKLFQLAHPQIANKAPRLMPSMVGFELLDVNDDETQATGVAVFRVGEQQVFVPVIYNDGALSGLNMMWLAEEDLFLPLDEEWIDYLLSRQPFSLGTTDKADKNETAADTLFQNMGEIFGKNAGEHHMAVLTSDRYKEAASRCDMGEVLPKFGENAALSVLQTVRNNDAFGRAFLSHYPLTKLAVVADKIEKGRKPSSDPINAGVKTKLKPQVLTMADVDLRSLGVTNAQKDELRRDGIIVKDPRNKDDVSKAYQVSTPTEWCSPKDPGIYNIVGGSGDIMKVIVMDDVVPIGDGTASCLVAVTMDKKYAGALGHETMVAVDDLSTAEWDAWFEKLPKIRNVSLNRGDEFIVVTSNMRSTVPLKFIGKVSGRNGTSIYVKQPWSVRTRRNWDGPCEIGSYSPLTRDLQRIRDEISMEYGETRTPFLETYVEKEISKGQKDVATLEEYDYALGRKINVVSTSEKDKMVVTGETLTVSDDCRVIKVSEAGNEDKMFSPVTTSMWPIMQKSGMRKVSVSSDRGEYTVRSGVLQSGRVTRAGALKHLICIHGLEKDAAIKMISTAEEAEKANSVQRITYAVKHAVSFPDFTLDTGTGATDSQQGIEESAAPADMDTGSGNPFLTEDVNSAIRAAQTGQKSVFDAAILNSLIRRHDIGAAVDEMLGDLTLGMDRVGRILFLLFTHKDQFEDRYGEDDMVNLEDSLDNLFKELGETVLFLKTKTVSGGSQDDVLGLVAVE